MNIIAFYSPKSRSGKDSSANFLIEYLQSSGRTIKRVSFADKLKEQCYQLFGSFGVKDREYYEKFPEERKIIIPELNMDVVELWVKYGNHMRDIYPDYWVDLALKDPLIQTYDYIVMADLRYKNELDYIRKYPSLVFNIKRNSSDVIKRGSDGKIKGKVFDININNNGTLEQLRTKIIKKFGEFQWAKVQK